MKDNVKMFLTIQATYFVVFGLMTGIPGLLFYDITFMGWLGGILYLMLMLQAFTPLGWYAWMILFEEY